MSPEEKAKFLAKYNLSRRNIEILQELLKGSSEKEIGEAVYLSIKGVKWQLGKIYKKIGIHCRQKLVVFFAQEGWYAKDKELIAKAEHKKKMSEMAKRNILPMGNA